MFALCPSSLDKITTVINLDITIRPQLYDHQHLCGRLHRLRRRKQPFTTPHRPPVDRPGHLTLIQRHRTRKDRRRLNRRIHRDQLKHTHRGPRAHQIQPVRVRRISACNRQQLDQRQHRIRTISRPATSRRSSSSLIHSRSLPAARATTSSRLETCRANISTNYSGNNKVRRAIMAHSSNGRGRINMR